MRPSIIISILVLAALAAILFVTPAHAYVPRYNPSEIAVDASGNVYAIMEPENAAGEGIFVYAPDGTGLHEYKRPRCTDIAIDGNGTVYVVYATGRRVERLEKDGSFSVVWHEDRPDNIVNYFTTGPNNDILVSDFNFSQEQRKIIDGSIIRLSPSGEVKSIIESTPDVPLTEYYRLSASSNGTIYLTHFNHTISAIYPDGSRSVIDRTRPDNGSLSQVTTVEAGPDGYLYVGEMANDSVMKLAPNGTLVARWYGCGPERFVSPVSIVARPDGRIYVSDMQNQRIVWFDGNRYQFGSSVTENTAGKGVLWDTVIAGDNDTVAREHDYYPANPLPSPGMDAFMALSGFCAAGACLFLGRIRKG